MKAVRLISVLHFSYKLFRRNLQEFYSGPLAHNPQYFCDAPFVQHKHSKHLSSCLYFVACLCFWHYPLNFELKWYCSQQTCPPFGFFVTVFQGTCQSFLISTFCTNFVFLHSKNFKFLLCLGLIDMLSANQNAEIFERILFTRKHPNC